MIPGGLLIQGLFSQVCVQNNHEEQWFDTELAVELIPTPGPAGWENGVGWLTRSRDLWLGTLTPTSSWEGTWWTHLGHCPDEAQGAESQETCRWVHAGGEQIWMGTVMCTVSRNKHPFSFEVTVIVSALCFAYLMSCWNSILIICQEISYCISLINSLLKYSNPLTFAFILLIIFSFSLHSSLDWPLS